MISEKLTITGRRRVILVTFTILSLLLSTSHTLVAADWIHYKTMQGGTIPTSDDRNIIIAGFIDDTHGIAIEVPLSIHYTEDGGKTWALTSDPRMSYEINLIEMLDARHVWVRSSVDLRFSSDAGMKWNEFPSYGSTFTSTHYLSFIDPNYGWYGLYRAGSAPVLSSTSDGGKTWNAVNVPKKANDRLWGIDLLTRETGYILLYGGSLYRTDNAGKTWSPAGTLPAKGRLFADTTYDMANAAIRFSDKNNGTAVVMCMKPRGYISFSTTDGGRTWTEDKMPQETKSFFGSIFLSRGGKYLTITDMENSSIVVCKRQ